MMGSKLNFDGYMAPVFTPFDDAHKLKLEIVPGYSKYLHASGIKGILVNGTSGEGCAQSLEERKAVAEAWAKCRPEGQTIVVQVGGGPLPDVIALAKHAEELGVDGIMCLHDLFFRPAGVDQLVDYLALVAAAAPRTPLFYYHLPGFTGINVSMSALLEKCASENKVPTFGGLKFTSSDLQELGKCVQVIKKFSSNNYRVFLGCDDLLLPAYTLGSISAIGTTFNIFPEAALKLEKLLHQGDFKKAAKAQEAISKAVNFITDNGLRPWVPSMKAAMNACATIEMGPTRNPQTSAFTQEQKNTMGIEVKNILSDIFV
ncbi:N-acetylneuraminate lyase-like [Neocloeon triangulifer]|uniref:N-acetylneuraminate lyase-like n=1 Tax=Neocloeon triangulifer TaxID=2078957 RepID=UPI00286ED1A3|nr:N-acetylneuraminate lyase-like [Neocloeon triangulifer]